MSTQSNDTTRTFTNNSRFNAALDRLAERYAAAPLGTLEVVSEYATAPAKIISGAEIDGSDDGDPYALTLPSEEDISRDYLLRHDWRIIPGVPRSQWLDPIRGDAMDFDAACERQAERDTRDFLAESTSAEVLEMRAYVDAHPEVIADYFQVCK